MKILIAPGSLFMEAVPPLREAGHELMVAETVDQFLSHPGVDRPDMCILAMAFAKAAASIKRREDVDQLLLVMLCAAELNADTVAHFRATQADDLIVYPCNIDFLLAKIAALERMHETHASLRHFKLRVEHELLLAQSMFHRIADIHDEDPPGVEIWNWPAGHFSGDFIAYGNSPSGRLHAMLVDATGHGLAAAVATIPAVDAFHELLADDRDMPELIEHLNKRLYRLLPTGHFCSAGLIRFDPEQGEIACWNGGLPPMLAMDSGLRVSESFTSRSPPLGIISRLDGRDGIETRSINNIKALIVYSDGVTETLAPDGQMFGEHALIDCLNRAGHVDHLIPQVREHLVRFTGGLEPADDITLMSIRLQCPEEAIS